MEHIVELNKPYSTNALSESAMEGIPSHSWEIGLGIQYHMITI